MLLDTYIDANDIQSIPFSVGFENGTDYFDGVFKDPSVSPEPKVAYFVDQQGRTAVLFQTNNKEGIVVHERYPGEHELLVLTTSRNVSYSHNSLAISRILEIPFDDVLTSINQGSDSTAFKKLLDERCYFDC